jgi:LPXTG-motif cell wall-anchored protein
MSIFNRRNAVMGWLTWVAAKRVMKKRARDAVPQTAEGSLRPNKGAIVAGLAALGGALWFWRRKSSDDSSDDVQPPAADES